MKYLISSIMATGLVTCSLTFVNSHKIYASSHHMQPPYSGMNKPYYGGQVPPPPPPPLPQPQPPIDQTATPVMCPEVCDQGTVGCLFPHPLSTKYFYQCINGKAQFSQCSHGKKFNEDLGECVPNIFEFGSGGKLSAKFTKELAKKIVDLEDLLGGFETKMNKIQKIIGQSDSKIQLMGKILLKAMKESRDSWANCKAMQGVLEQQQQSALSEAFGNSNNIDDESQLFIDKALAEMDQSESSDTSMGAEQSPVEEKLEGKSEEENTTAKVDAKSTDNGEDKSTVTGDSGAQQAKKQSDSQKSIVGHTITMI